MDGIRSLYELCLSLDSVMILLVGGMQRSGSTFAFNIAREILAKYGKVSVAATESIQLALESVNGEKNLIIKNHNPDLLTTRLINNSALYCICTIRKPEDAVGSWMRTFDRDIETSIAAIGNWLEWYRQVSNNVLKINYETIDLHPLYAILRIQKYLLGTINIFDAVKLWRKYRKKLLKKHCDNLTEGTNTINAGFTYYDSNTLLHRRHISSIKSKSAKEYLTNEQILFIREGLKKYVSHDGALTIDNIRKQM